jgi:cell division topological specificity factor
MSWIDLFRTKKRNTATTAKERLQIVISHERTRQSQPDLISAMQTEILSIIAKYLGIPTDKIQEQVKVDVERRGEHSVLELNITLPEPATHRALPKEATAEGG